MRFKAKEKCLPSYQFRIDHVRDTVTAIRTRNLIDRQPEVSYVHNILYLLDMQILAARYALARKCTFKGRIKRLLHCRDRLDCHLNGMVTRINDLSKQLEAGLEERQTGIGERLPTKTEGRSVWRLSIVMEEDNEAEETENFVNAVEEQVVE